MCSNIHREAAAVTTGRIFGWSRNGSSTYMDDGVVSYAMVNGKTGYRHRLRYGSNTAVQSDVRVFLLHSQVRGEGGDGVN